jgi:hypothetical protein
MATRDEYHSDLVAVRVAVEALDRAVRGVRIPAGSLEGVDDGTTIAIALANEATMRALVADLPGAWQLIGVESLRPRAAIPDVAIPDTDSAIPG